MMSDDDDEQCGTYDDDDVDDDEMYRTVYRRSTVLQEAPPVQVPLLKGQLDLGRPLAVPREGIQVPEWCLG